MGRSPRGRWAVAARCHLGIPTVISSHPRLEDGSPFPTHYWLTCPILNKRCSGLESRGQMEIVNRRLAADGSLRDRLAAAIERYRSSRDSHEQIDDRGAPPGGGPDRVKCLHAHVAHELAGGNNVVGALTLATVGWPDCIEPCFEVPGR